MFVGAWFYASAAMEVIKTPECSYLDGELILLTIQCTINAQRHVYILEQHVFPSRQGKTCLCQQDKAKLHNGTINIEWRHN